jgi:hypothetical protein
LDDHTLACDESKARRSLVSRIEEESQGFGWATSREIHRAKLDSPRVFRVDLFATRDQNPEMRTSIKESVDLGNEREVRLIQAIEYQKNPILPECFGERVFRASPDLNPEHGRDGKKQLFRFSDGLGINHPEGVKISKRFSGSL